VHVLSPSNAPHLYLGVDSKADSASLGAAFAKATRRIKVDNQTGISVQDLTSALSAAERRTESALILQYQVPANPDVIPDTAVCTVGTQEFLLDTDVASFPVDKVPAEKAEMTASFLLKSALLALHQWKWSEAVLRGQHCLHLSRNEDIRDEALNIIAAALAMQQEPQKALAALKQAVTGRWNLNLQGNLVLIATSISPLDAVEHLSHLILGAESAKQRLEASRMAADLWAQLNKELTGDAAPPLPRAVLDALYDLMKQSGLTEEEFFDIGIFLAESDVNEFQKKGVVRESPHCASVSARMVSAASQGFGEYAIALVAAETKGEMVGRLWLQSRLDAMVGSLNDLFISEEAAQKPVDFAFGLIDNGLSCKTLERLSLLSFMVWHLQDIFTEENEVPKDEFVMWMIDAYRTINAAGAFGDRNPDHVELVKGFVQSATNALMFLFFRGAWNQGIEVERHVNSLIQEGQKWFPNRTAMSHKAREIVNWSDGVTRSCQPLRLRCSDDELNTKVDELLGFVSQFKSLVSHLA
jgi:hypothetical protein